MKIVSPFYVIFNTNNWIYHPETSSFSYSDDIVSLNTVYFEVPLKEDPKYNKGLYNLLKGFIETLFSQLSKKHQLKICTNVFKLLENKNTPYKIHFKSATMTHQNMYFEFEPA